MSNLFSLSPPFNMYKSVVTLALFCLFLTQIQGSPFLLERSLFSPIFSGSSLNRLNELRLKYYLSKMRENPTIFEGKIPDFIFKKKYRFFQ